MLGDAIEDIIADTRDAVGEITNMISGQARATLSEMGLPLQGSTPSIVFGANHSLSFPGQVTTVAIPFETDYGAFTLLMQYYTVPELLFEVSNSCFMPPPKVTSAVVRCVTRKAPPVQVRSEEAFWRTVRAGFALRRKTLVNSLQTGWQLPKEQLAAIVAGCGLSPTVRGEALGLEEYARLSDALLAAAGE